MDPPFMENHLLWYLDKYLCLKESMELTTEPLDSEHHLRWSRANCLFVLTYVVQFGSCLDHSQSSHAIMALDKIAKSVHASYIKQHGDEDDNQYGIYNGSYGENQEDNEDEINKKRLEFSEMLVNSFIPDVVPKFFTVPKLHQLPDKVRHLKPNEILVVFIDFLLQVLYHEAVTNEDEEQQNALTLLRKQLSFLLAVLGDVPFQSSDHQLAENVQNLLVEIEVLANDAGTMLYDRVFHIHLVETSRFEARCTALSEKFELLNLRLSSLIQKIKVTHMRLQNSGIHASKSLKDFDSEQVPFGSTEDPATMEENNYVDVNSDSTEKNNYRKKLELRYKCLPHYIKPCSLYMATVPEDYKISKEQLAWMWIAEDCSISERSHLRSFSFVCLYRQKEEKILRDLWHNGKLKCICGGGDVIFPDMSNLWDLNSLKICFEISLRDIIEVRNFNFPSTLKKLCLSGAVLTGEHMSMIGRLWSLRVLKLENHAFVGDKWEIKEEEFEKLRVLKIESRDLNEWRCDSNSWFPSLKSLVVTGCSKLEHIPGKLLYSPRNLQRVEVMKCGLGAYFALEWEKSQPSGAEVVTDKDVEQIFVQDIDLHDEEALMDPPSTRDMSDYWKEHMPRNWDTFTFVVHYAMQFHSNLYYREFHDVVKGLDRIARSYFERRVRLKGFSCWSYETERKHGEFSELFVNSFIPEVQKFFKVSKLHQLNDKDKHLNRNEILAAFLNFLLQLLHRQENVSSNEEQVQSILRNQLSFLLALLGDIPFQPTHHGLEEQANNLLEEFEMLANELGSFMYSCVFSISDSDCFYAEIVNLVVRAELLNANIKHHCEKFSEIPMSVVPRLVVDSFFIFDSLIEEIENLVNHEINFIDENEKENQIGRLKDALNISKTIIKVAERTPPGDDANEEKEALIQVRELAYQAEYLINSHVVGNIPAWYLNLRLPCIVQEIKIVNAGLRQVKKVHDGNVRKASDGEASSRTWGNPETMEDNDFLTFNDDRENNILDDLIRRTKSREIISIHGMPGLGKTTTATKLYNCQKVLEHFDRRAWCVVSQAYSLRALFLQILKGISPPDKEDLEKETAKLGEIMHKALYQKRYLIVLDDVWDSEVLDKMILQLPDDRNGSRVIVTSRVKGVSPDKSIFHTLSPLSNDQCWDLLKKKVFPKELCPLQLDDVGKQIAEKCCGIPLAVVTTAGILVHLDKERSVWERVAEQLDVLLLDDQSNYRKILELSYEHLPSYLKPCFLYYAAFPEDAEISKTELTWLWIAEGFIPKEENKNQEKIAESCFLDLINRSLVQPGRRGSDGRISTCRIHDLLHDISVAKANEENFIKSSTKVFSIYEKHQGLFLPSASDIVLRPFGLHCRSFRDRYTYQPSYLRTMALMKTVELPPKEFRDHSLPRFDLPAQLRYLCIGELEKRILANLVKLEFIQVRSEEKRVVVPSVILRMVKLRHLLIREDAEFEDDCSNNILETTSLISLSNVWIRSKKDEDILSHSPHLKKLKCKCDDEISFPDLSALAGLESLKMHSEARLLRHIVVPLSKGSFPSSIKKLALCWTGFPWEKMTIIGQLPKLEVLKLQSLAFIGDEWETNDDEFQELRFLKIDNLELKRWITASSHFPILEQLVISQCYSLDEVPSDLGDSQELRRIDVRSCGRSRGPSENVGAL